MSGNIVLQCGRPSVIMYVGKNSRSVVDDRSNLAVAIIQAHTTMTQEHNPSPVSDKSVTNQDPIINEELVSKSKSKRKVYSCMTCERKFSWRSHLACHERTHTGEKPFQCNICDKAFARSDGLQCHKKVHFKIKENGSCKKLDEAALRQQNIFPCTICGRTFASLAGYSRHKENKHKG